MNVLSLLLIAIHSWLFLAYCWNNFPTALKKGFNGKCGY